MIKITNVCSGIVNFVKLIYIATYVYVGIAIYVASNNYCCKQVLYDVLPYKNQAEYKDCTHVQFLESHKRKYSIHIHSYSYTDAVKM